MHDETDFTGGQQPMQNMIVETTPAEPERLNVFRATPFEFELTAPALTSTSVVGRAVVVDTRPTIETMQPIERWSAPLGTGMSTRRR